MPIIQLYHSGLTGGIPPMQKNSKKSKRGIVTGWSSSASKRNIAFLRSVRPDSLTGKSYAITLTLKNCPPSSSDWHKIRRAFIERLRRRGLIRMHWVTEWQRRGVPHLHGMVFFDDNHPDGLKTEIIDCWLSVSKKYTSTAKAQHIMEVTDTIGWFKYLSKHAARGHLHYQRNASSIPKEWQKTGRVWGYLGNWETDEAIKIDMDKKAFYRFRRIVRSWRIADARSTRIKIAKGFYIPDIKRIKSARTMLKSNKREVSSVRGVSEWIPLELALTICDFLRSEGYHITS